MIQCAGYPTQVEIPLSYLGIFDASISSITKLHGLIIHIKRRCPSVPSEEEPKSCGYLGGDEVGGSRVAAHAGRVGFKASSDTNTRFPGRQKAYARAQPDLYRVGLEI